MFTNMGTTQSSIAFADYSKIQHAIRFGKTIIHIMDVSDETILIKGTLPANKEVEQINIWLLNNTLENKLIRGLNQTLFC